MQFWKCHSLGLHPALFLTFRPSEDRQASPPAWAILEAPLKQVHTMRSKSFLTGNPFENKSSSGTTVQPRRTPVNPANLEKDETSIATYKRKENKANINRYAAVEKHWEAAYCLRSKLTNYHVPFTQKLDVIMVQTVIFRVFLIRAYGIWIHIDHSPVFNNVFYHTQRWMS